MITDDYGDIWEETKIRSGRFEAHGIVSFWGDEPIEYKYVGWPLQVWYVPLSGQGASEKLPLNWMFV